MDKKRILIILVVLIIVGIILIGNVYFMKDSHEKTNLTITSDDNLTNEDVLTLRLTNESNIGIANKTVNINLTDSNNNTKTINVTTDSKGNGNFTLNISAGNYTVNASFSGDEHYKTSYTLQNLTVVEEAIETGNYESSSVQSSNSQYDSSYSDDYEDDGIVYSTDPNSDKSVLDENGNIDQDKVDYYNQIAHEKYGPIG
ncbi:MAG: carboxypeptidase regulatory-like domain-containing protein [Methanobrevibacter thaueri]|uniref:Carboxypeptidase regulatory-like domain-containing protein n=1 Tax=Methanobrevibacter thaueri TaxID=190975 RepID=A0A8T3VDE1_9EURY|nr:Ig-like domain-containing protein [Methanobrevibacter thaueri]MBE6501274.1 carboxypeptidase regulatory-like domain-containing protein [Methanobrevibacter thaueri]